MFLWFYGGLVCIKYFIHKKYEHRLIMLFQDGPQEHIYKDLSTTLEILRAFNSVNTQIIL